MKIAIPEFEALPSGTHPAAAGSGTPRPHGPVTAAVYSITQSIDKDETNAYDDSK